MEGGETCGEAKSTCYTRNPWIKSNKTSSHQQITKKVLGLFLVGIFEIGEEHNKIKLENTTGRLGNRDQRGSRYQDDVGWNPRWTIFHERSGSREEHEEHEGKHERITQTNKNDHTYTRSMNTKGDT